MMPPAMPLLPVSLPLSPSVRRLYWCEYWWWWLFLCMFILRPHESFFFFFMCLVFPLPCIILHSLDTRNITCHYITSRRRWWRWRWYQDDESLSLFLFLLLFFLCVNGQQFTTQRSVIECSTLLFYFFFFFFMLHRNKLVMFHISLSLSLSLSL